MANHASHAALPYPVKGARYTVLLPGLDADGDPTASTTPDTEISKDNGAAADCAEEVSATSGMDGMNMLTLSGAEMDCSCAALHAKVASGPKATLITLFPRVLPVLFSGTAQAGAAGTITVATDIPAIAKFLIGCIVKTTGGTGGGGTGGANNQARVITAFSTGRVATVVPNWETTPDSTTTYEILLTEAALLRFADLAQWLSSTPNALVSSRVDVSVGAMANNVLTASAIATDAITSSKVADGFLTAAKFASGAFDAVWSVTTRTLSAFGFSVTVGTNNDKTGYGLSAAAVQAVWDAATSALTTAGSIGRLLVDNINVALNTLATASGLTTVSNKLGAWAGSGRNTVLGWAQAMFRKDADATVPSDVNADLGGGAGTANNTTESLEALRDSRPANFSSLVINGSGRVDIGTWLGVAVNALISGRVDANAQVVGDKTGFALTAAQHIAFWDVLESAVATANSMGVKLKNTLPFRLTKNTAFNNFHFVMVQSSDHLTPATGLTVTATRLLDDGTFGACANAVVEEANGLYRINLAAADLNGDSVTLRFTATGADTRLITILTAPAAA